MIRSMTGFAEKKFDSKNFSVKIQIKSLNHRFFDWNFRGNQFSSIETKLRSLTQKKIYRGRVDVTFEAKVFNPSQWEIEINESLMTTLFAALRKVSSDWGKDKSISVDNVLSVPHIVEIRRKAFLPGELSFVERSYMETLEELILSKTREGKDILKAIRGHVLAIKRSVSRLPHAAKKQPLLIRKKLRERIKELTAEVPIPEEKIALEVSFLAQRFDLNEEIERIQSHVDHMQACLVSETAAPLGKKMDFIAQEIQREVNTLNAKAQDMSIIRECLAIKGEIESIRQQIQNLE